VICGAKTVGERNPMITRRDTLKLGGGAAACAGLGLNAGKALAADRILAAEHHSCFRP